jgi:hypothetical protein
MISEIEISITVFLTIVAAYFWFIGVTNIKRKFKDANANSPESAVKPEEAGITWEGLWLELVAERTKDGRYFLPTETKIASALILVAAATVIAIVGVVFDTSPFFLVLSWVVAAILISAVKSLKRPSTTKR